MMDYATPIPMIWCKREEFNDARTKRQSFNGWLTQYSDSNMVLYSEEQMDVVLGQLSMMAHKLEVLEAENEKLKKQTECLEPAAAPQYVWMVSTKTFMALFDSRESAEAAVNHSATATSYIPPVAVPVFSGKLPS